MWVHLFRKSRKDILENTASASKKCNISSFSSLKFITFYSQVKNFGFFSKKTLGWKWKK